MQLIRLSQFPQELLQHGDELDVRAALFYLGVLGRDEVTNVSPGSKPILPRSFYLFFFVFLWFVFLWLFIIIIFFGGGRAGWMLELNKWAVPIRCNTTYTAGHPTIYSLSPGRDMTQEIGQAKSISSSVNIYRVTDDWHGGNMDQHFQIASAMQGAGLIGAPGKQLLCGAFHPCCASSTVLCYVPFIGQHYPCDYNAVFQCIQTTQWRRKMSCAWRVCGVHMTYT